MSIPARSSATNKNSLGSVISRVKDINNETNMGSDDITKSIKDLASIARIMKNYVNPDKKEEKTSEKQNKICRVYGCIYQGTYNGIIDGLRQVAKDNRAKDLKKDRLDSTKTLIKGTAMLSAKTAKIAVQSPIIIAKGIAELFAFERSEFLNFFRAIYHGVGYNGTSVDYAQKAFRLQAVQEHDRKKLLKKGNLLTQNETIIELLGRISDTSEEQAMRDRKFFLTRALFGKKESVQIELLRKINEELIQIEDNTGGGRSGMFSIKAALIDNLPILAPFIGAAAIGIGSTYGLGGAGATTLANLLGDSVGGVISSGISSIGSLINDPLSAMGTLAGIIGGGFLFKNLFKGTRSVADTQNIIMIDQLKVLEEIRDAVAGEEIMKGGLGGFVTKFKNFSLKKAIFRDKKEFAKTSSELSNEKLEDIILELEHNTDYQEDILYGINRNFALNRMRASDGRELLKKIDNGLTVIPFSAGRYTEYEAESLELLKDIGLWNQEEYIAIGDIPKQSAEEMCKCLVNTNTRGSTDGEILESMEKTRQNNLENSLDDTEERRDNLKRQTALYDRVDDIYKVLDNLSPSSTDKKKEDNLLISTAKKVTTGLDTLNDLGGVKDLLTNETVNLSKKSLAVLCRCSNKGRGTGGSGGDGGDVGDRDKKNKKNKNKPKKTPRRLKKLAMERDAGKFKGKKGIFKRVLSNSRGFVDVGGMKDFAKKGFTKSGELIKKIPVKKMAVGTKDIIKGLGPKAIFAGATAGIGAVFTDMLMPDSVGDGTLEGAKARGELINPEWEAYLKKEADFHAKAKVKAQAKFNEKPMIVVNPEPLVKPLAKVIATPIATELSKTTEAIKNATNGWQDSVQKGWQSSVQKVSDLTDSVGWMDVLKNSQTAAALQNVYTDASALISGGNISTTNISLPVSPNDTDRGTSLLVNGQGA